MSDVHKETKHVIRRNSPKSRASATPPLEWLLGAFGALLLASGVSFLVYEGVTDGEEPGALVVTVTEIRNVGSAYIVKFTVHNNGGETLSHLHLTARLMDGNSPVESAQALIDYLPGHAKQEGGVYLSHDPRRYALEIIPAGYMKP